MACDLGPEHHVWPRARAAALERDGHRCVECGTIAELHVHHVVPCEGDRSPGCAHHQANLRTLCSWHHRLAHGSLLAHVEQLALPIAA